MKIRLLTFHFIHNNGAAMFCYSLWEALKSILPEADIEFLDYRPLGMHLNEELKAFKLMRDIPFFYWQRNKVFNRFIKSHLPLGKRYPILTTPRQFFRSLKLSVEDSLIVGMDVWCLSSSRERAPFPDVYWLQDGQYKKIAYAVSAYKSQFLKVNQYSMQISQYLQNFQLIAVRDTFTRSLVMKLNYDPAGVVLKVPDPTFLFRLNPEHVKQKLIESGVDFKKPIAGVLLFGQEELMQAVYQYFHARGYQVVALSMYSHYADLNMGHILDPFEWANTFAHFKFCVTNRFHGTLFCLKSQTPFLALQTELLEARENCKILDLLRDFSLEDAYMNIHDGQFGIKNMLDRIDYLQENWSTSYSPLVAAGLEEMRIRSLQSLELLKSELIS